VGAYELDTFMISCDACGLCNFFYPGVELLLRELRDRDFERVKKACPSFDVREWLACQASLN